MAEIRIRNWHKFQHYKDRNPPWIKLHYDLLSSRDWVMLDDTSKLLAVVCMLLASRNDGFVPDDPEFIQRVAYLKKPADLKPLIKCGFLEVADSDRKQMLADDTTEERRGEKRRGEIPFEDFWAIYPKHAKPSVAKKKWEALTVKNQKLAMAALPAHVESWDNPKYIPHATTWMNQKRWEDDIESMTKPQSSLSKEIAALGRRLKRPPSAIEEFFEQEGRLPTCEEDFDG